MCPEFGKHRRTSTKKGGEERRGIARQTGPGKTTGPRKNEVPKATYQTEEKDTKKQALGPTLPVLVVGTPIRRRL